ncbi:hypothetical protein [Aliikangiella sp. G2MR2-5]|uniref:hypothetical protein n=1 Tax=Aliikangiella sp. G2MR2-5 TaxID=2788943 RepID=UPI001AEE5C2E|nr:hypothetical protein [Aliikangiella sp. G2MR2-5]
MVLVIIRGNSLAYGIGATEANKVNVNHFDPCHAVGSPENQFFEFQFHRKQQE